MKRFYLLFLFLGVLFFGFAQKGRAEISPGNFMEFFGGFGKSSKPVYEVNTLLSYHAYSDSKWGGFVGVRGTLRDSIKVFGGVYWHLKSMPWLKMGVGGGGTSAKSRSPRGFGFGLIQLGDNSKDFFILATLDVGSRKEYGYSYRMDASFLSADDYSVRPGFLIERFSGVGPKVSAELDRDSKMVIWVALLWSSSFFDTKTVDPTGLIGLRFNFDRI